MKRLVRQVWRTELRPVDLLARVAYMYPEKVAAVHGKPRLTYAELGERAWRLANALRAAGLEKGDRVATLLPNVWHPDGNVELRDRGKDIIISDGENISSIEVEQTIAAHPAVLECAVVAIPHPHWGERPKAFVTLKHDHIATAAEIIAFTRDRLAHYKCPDDIEFGPLPKTSTGKVRKYVLREKEWVGRDTRIGAA
jgi:acyl-CoA synthetase (AMP-forming)/AMP-acid ligase II